MTDSNEQISVNLRQFDSMKFGADVGDGRKITLSSSGATGEAFSPMELFLVALAGCTAMDVQLIMVKQRQKLDLFDVKATGFRRHEDPKFYDRIEIKYAFTGRDLRKDAVHRAIRLSLEEYCPVRAMMRRSIQLKAIYTIASPGQTEKMYQYEPPQSN